MSIQSVLRNWQCISLGC